MNDDAQTTQTIEDDDWCPFNRLHPSLPEHSDWERF